MLSVTLYTRTLQRSIVPCRYTLYHFLSEWSNTSSILERTIIEKISNFCDVLPNTAVLFRKRYYGTCSDNSLWRRRDKVAELLQFRTNLNVYEWNKVLDNFKKDKSFKYLTSFDGPVMYHCLFYKNWELANSYLEYLACLKKEPNLLCLKYYLELCAERFEECGEERIFEVYGRLTSKTKVFDVMLAESACLALAKTSRWTEPFKYIPLFQLFRVEPSRSYNALMGAAFRNGKYNTGFQFLERLCRTGMGIHNAPLIDCIKSCRSSEDKEAKVETLVQNFSRMEIFPETPVAEELMQFYKEDLGWSVRYVKISNDGICPACNHRLKYSEIDKETITKLKEEFESRNIIGSDIYQTSSPEEWSRFKTFMEQEGPFTTIFDGLNVAFVSGSTDEVVFMKNLQETVTKLKFMSRHRKGSIMVIVRKHVESWSPRHLNALKTLAKVFIVDNMSMDDGFVIYAALHSGLGTQFVSSDFLREHIYRLRDASLQRKFRTWKRHHQIFPVPNKRALEFQLPPEFTCTPQKHGSLMWHIPYNDGSTCDSFEVPHTWLCLHADQWKHKKVNTGDHVSEVPFKLPLLQENLSGGTLQKYSSNPVKRHNKSIQKLTDNTVEKHNYRDGNSIKRQHNSKHKW